jgi:hypothetical protein
MRFSGRSIKVGLGKRTLQEKKRLHPLLMSKKPAFFSYLLCVSSICKTTKKLSRASFQARAGVAR